MTVKEYLIALLRRSTTKSTYEIEERESIEKGKYSRVPLECVEDNSGYRRLLVRDDGFSNTWVNPLNYQQPIDIQSVYSDNLFVTTTNLGAGATYTSSTFDLQNYKRITGKFVLDRIYSIYIDESDDGSTFDNTYSVTGVSASTVTTIDYNIKTRYVRIRIRNEDGVNATTVLRCSAYRRVL